MQDRRLTDQSERGFPDSIMQYFENRTFDEIRIGDCASLRCTLSKLDIELFAVMSGDVNPTHLDEEFARSDVFHKVVAHGMWGGALISAVLGTQLPGPGTVYVRQDLRFRRPVGVGETLTVTVTATAKDESTHKITFDCQCVNQDGAPKPGLYEMKISNPANDPDCRKPQYSVAFEERNVEDIHFDYPREEFERVRKLSEFNESLYSTFVSPWVRTMANPLSAALLKWLHPMRVSRYMFSEKLSPWMRGVGMLAPWVREHRQEVSADNPFLAVERAGSQAISTALDQYRDQRDRTAEVLFKQLYA